MYVCNVLLIEKINKIYRLDMSSNWFPKQNTTKEASFRDFALFGQNSTEYFKSTSALRPYLYGLGYPRQPSSSRQLIEL